MRQTAAIVMLVLTSACGAEPAWVEHGRQGSWHRVSAPAFTAGPSSSIGGLVAPGDGFGAWTAAGSVRDGRTTAVAWTSADGTRWVRSDLDQGDGRESEASAGARRQGMVAVAGTVITRRGDRDGRVWTSRDGGSWSVATVPAGGPGDQRVTSVAGGPLGFVAAGVDGSLPAVWFSPDGMSWTRVGGPFQKSQRIEAVAVGPQGAVAVGTITTSGDVDGMAWFSADGSTWRTVPLGGAAGFTGPVEQAVHAVTARADGFVAVGDDANSERRVAAAWTSADGISWRREPANDMTVSVSSTAGVSAVSVGGSGPLVAAGGSSSAQLWSSADGRRWAREEPPPSARLDASGARATTDGRAVLLATGTSGLWLRAAGAAWTDVGADPTVFPRAPRTSTVRHLERLDGRYLAFGYETGDVALWRSPDGLAWERQADPDGVFRDALVDALTVRNGMAIAGGAGPPTAGNVTNVANVAAVWVSDDGGTGWRRVDSGNPAFSIRFVTQLTNVTVGRSGVVATGISWDGTTTIDAHAWHSPDGLTWRRASDPAAWSGPGDQTPGEVCVLPDGGFLMLARSVVMGRSEDSLWLSPDGITWERGSTVAGTLFSCASTPTGVLVAGRVAGASGDDGRLLRTTDGRTWTDVGASGALSDATDDTLVRVTTDGDRIVVAARLGDDVGAYTSADGGKTWRRYAAAVFRGPGDQGVWDVVIAGDKVVMTGIDNASGAVWMGPAP